MNQVSAIKAHPYRDPAAEQCFPMLPEGMERDNFIRLFSDVAQSMFGLTEAEISTFRTMAEVTRPSAWKQGTENPCCYKQQQEVASRRHKSRFSIARHERRLSECGLIEKRVTAGGARSGYGGCGIFFAKAIDLVPAMQAHAAMADAEARERNLLCNTRSVHKGHCKSALTALRSLVDDPAEALEMVEQYESWPDARVLRTMDMEALHEHVAEADELTQKVLITLSELEDMQHRCVTDATPYIQDTSEDLNSDCNASVSKMPDCKQPDISVNAEPYGSSKGKENKNAEPTEHHKNEFHLKLGGITLFELCSQNMQMYLSARMDGKLEPNPHDIDCAVQAMLPELGINQSAWADACSAMGRDTAAMCVILADANMDHPQLPVRNPGGYLRGMTNAYRAGELNIMGSLIALSQRRHAENEASKR